MPPPATRTLLYGGRRLCDAGLYVGDVNHSQELHAGVETEKERLGEPLRKPSVAPK
jgi:hypothetical protein